MEKNQQKQYLITVVVAVIVGAVAFGAGMKWQQKKTALVFNQAGGGFGNRAFGNGPGAGQGGRTGMMGGARGGFRPVNGQIISIDDTSITVKMADGSSRIVLLSDKTSINKASSASRADLKNGETVAVFGSDNSDGSVTASSIQLDPAQLRGGMMIQGATTSASGKPNGY